MQPHQRQWRRGGTPSQVVRAPWRRQVYQHPHRTPPPNALGMNIKHLSMDDLDVSRYHDSARITDVKHIASYNLTQGQKILIPGRPALWTPRTGEFTVQKDAGVYYRDHNAAHFPDRPMEPAIQSILELNPDFRTSDIDIVACASTLASLLKFASNKPGPFSFLVHAIGATVFFVRRGHTAKDIIPDVMGYGHNFVDDNTSWGSGMAESESHQRIITYKLGGHNIALRFEADCFVLNQHDDLDDSTSGAEVDGGVPLESMLAVSSITRAVPERKEVHLTIDKRGSVVSHSQLVENKTKRCDEERPGQERSDLMQKEMHRFWLRQIPHLVLGVHRRGTFDNPVAEDIVNEISAWEASNKDVISGLAAVIAEIRALASKDKVLEVRCEDEDSSQLHINLLSEAEAGQWHAISRETGKRWSM